MSSPIKVFITGACAGLAEVRQALSSHPDVEIVGTAVEPAKAQEKLAASGAQVVLHGSARGDRLPTADVDAIRQATAAPLMLVTSGNASGLLHEALAAGVADVVLLPQLTDALVFTIRKTTQLVHQRAANPVASLRPSTDGKIITIFSPKGGVGKTVLACGLATQLARKCERRALLLDLDLQFGDAAIMMGIEPEKTIYDLVMTGDSTPRSSPATSRRTRWKSTRVRPRAARGRGARRRGARRRLLDVAKESYDAIVVDTPAFFQATTLATLDRTERLLLVCSLDIPTVKNVKLTLQTLNLLHYPEDRIHLVLNRSGGKGELKRSEVEKALDLKVSFELPNDREVGVAVNRGVPVPLSAPRCGVSKALSEMATTLVAAPGSSEGRRGRRRGKQEAEGGTRRGSVKLRKAA